MKSVHIHITSDEVKDHSNRSAYYREAVFSWMRRSTDQRLEINLERVTEYEACVFGDGCKNKIAGHMCYHMPPICPSWEARQVSVDPHPNIDEAVYRSGFRKGEALDTWAKADLHQKNVSNALQVLKKKGAVTKASGWSHEWCLADGLETYQEQMDHYHFIGEEKAKKTAIERNAQLQERRQEEESILEALIQRIQEESDNWSTEDLIRFNNDLRRRLPEEWRWINKETSADPFDSNDTHEEDVDWIDVSGDLEQS